ncbi:MAG: hypothetical protein ACYDBX_03795 [Patescibacteria group bacterium]
MKVKDRSIKTASKASKLGWRNDLMSTEILSIVNRGSVDSANVSRRVTVRPFGGNKKRTAE